MVVQLEAASVLVSIPLYFKFQIQYHDEEATEQILSQISNRTHAYSTH